MNYCLAKKIELSFEKPHKQNMISMKTTITSGNNKCYEKLLKKREEIGIKKSILVNSIISTSALESISQHLPTTKCEMLSVPNVERWHYKKYGKKNHQNREMVQRKICSCSWREKEK